MVDPSGKSKPSGSMGEQPGHECQGFESLPRWAQEELSYHRMAALEANPLLDALEAIIDAAPQEQPAAGLADADVDGTFDEGTLFGRWEMADIARKGCEANAARVRKAGVVYPGAAPAGIPRSAAAEAKRLSRQLKARSAGTNLRNYTDRMAEDDRKAADVLAMAAFLPGPSAKAVCGVKTMKTSAGDDYYVSVECGGRELTPHKFGERWKAEYEAAEWEWLLNGGVKPDLMAFGPRGSRRTKEGNGNG